MNETDSEMNGHEQRLDTKVDWSTGRGQAEPGPASRGVQWAGLCGRGGGATRDERERPVAGVRATALPDRFGFHAQCQLAGNFSMNFQLFSSFFHFRVFKLKRN